MDARTLARSARQLLALPMLAGYLSSSARALIASDVRRWQSVQGRPEDGLRGLLCCLSEQSHEFRNLYYHRLARGSTAGRVMGRLLRLLFSTERTLYLDTDDIGPGLFIQHGFSTMIAAQSIGANCWINQQVSVGFRAVPDGETLASPVILDGVTIGAGAKVLGGITVGRNAVIGANAVVVKDVPDDSVAVGVPAQNRAKGPHAPSAQ